MDYKKLLSDKKKKKTDKMRFMKEKNAIRIVGRIPEEVKETATGEAELFERIGDKRMYKKDGVMVCDALHIDEVTGKECIKPIPRAILTHVNYDHRKNKSRGEDLRLSEENIDIVSFAYHFNKHNGQILRLVYQN